MAKLSPIKNSIRLYYTYLGEALSYFTRRDKVHSFPIVFQIEPTNHCPMNCVMCPRQFMKRKLGYMDFALFKKIIDQVKVYDTHIQLHHFGDPLMHPEIDKFIRYCHDKGIVVNCSVNPILLTKNMSERLVDSGLDRIYISLDSVDDYSYKKIRGTKANYGKAVENIKYLAGLKVKKNKKNPHISIGLIYMSSTKGNVDEFKKRWVIPGIDSVCIKPFTGFGLKSILEHADDSTKKRIEHKCEYPCFLPWRSITILWDGRVVPCCYDYDGKCIIGDLNRETLKQVWNNDRMLKLRKQNRLNDFTGNDLCGPCNERYGWPSVAHPLKLSGYAYRKAVRKVRGEP
jgi:radical SAM protein with 4Fe4S-binding SPASM domain